MDSEIWFWYIVFDFNFFVSDNTNANKKDKSQDLISLFILMSTVTSLS